MNRKNVRVEGGRERGRKEKRHRWWMKGRKEEKKDGMDGWMEMKEGGKRMDGWKKEGEKA